MINIISITSTQDGKYLTPSVFVKEYKSPKTAAVALKRMRHVKCIFNSKDGTWLKNKNNNSVKCYSFYVEHVDSDVIRDIYYGICDINSTIPKKLGNSVNYMLFL